MEYQCFYLDPACRLAHNDNDVLFESNSLGECCNFAYKRFLEDGRDIAVWQPRIESYRDIYRAPHRDAKGRFARLL